MLETLQRLAAKTLERKRRLGHYAVIWQDGKPVLTGESTDTTKDTAEQRRVMPSKRTSEAAFETAIESILLADGYTPVDSKAFDRERALFPNEALAFIRAAPSRARCGTSWRHCTASTLERGCWSRCSSSGWNSTRNCSPITWPSRSCRRWCRNGWEARSTIGCLRARRRVS